MAALVEKHQTCMLAKTFGEVPSLRRPNMSGQSESVNEHNIQWRIRWAALRYGQPCAVSGVDEAVALHRFPPEGVCRGRSFVGRLGVMVAPRVCGSTC